MDDKIQCATKWVCTRWHIVTDPWFETERDQGTPSEEIDLNFPVFVDGAGATSRSPEEGIQQSELQSIQCAFESLLQSPVFFDNPEDQEESIREDLASIMRRRIDNLQDDHQWASQHLDVVVIGNACTDVFVKTDANISLPTSEKGSQLSYTLGKKILINELEFHTGGGGANVSATLARFGLRTGFFGRIGADMRGHRLFQWLYKNNIVFLGQVASISTGFSVILRSRNYSA